MKKILVSGFLGLGMLLAPMTFAQDQKLKGTDADMQRAIQWEHQKDAAAARQAAIERQHSTIKDAGPAVNSSADRSADREDMSGFAKTPSASFRTEPTASELAAAVAWEHQKDAAAARQAKIGK